MQFDSATMIDVTSAPYNAVGDGVTDNSAAISAAITASGGGFVSPSQVGKIKTLWFPAGDYLISTSQNFLKTPVAGELKQTYNGVQYTQVSRITSPAGTVVQHNLFLATDMAFQNINTYDYPYVFSNFTVSLVNCTFILDVPGVVYWMKYGQNIRNFDYNIQNCTFINTKRVYITLWVYAWKSINIENCKIIGGNTHHIRVDQPYSASNQNLVSIRDNLVDGQGVSTTGIFIASQRVMPMDNITIQGNKVMNINEEGIAMDGFGNNAGLCPVICNGVVNTFTQDPVTNRLTVNMDNMLFYGTAPNQPITVSNTSYSGVITSLDTNIANRGSGYTNGTYSNVVLNGGNGIGATANIVVATNRVNTVTLVSGGKGYQQTDVLTATLPGGSGFSVLISGVTPNWVNYKFVFSDGTGQEGSVFDIFSANGSPSTNLSYPSETFFYSNTAFNQNLSLPAYVEAPNLTTTATRYFSTTTNGFHSYGFEPQASWTGDYVLSFYARQVGTTAPYLVAAGIDGNTGGAYFNFDTGASVSTDGAVASMQYLEKGWWRCSVSSNNGPTSQAKMRLYASTTTTAVQFAGSVDGGGNPNSGFDFWGIQWESGTLPTAYTKTTSSQIINQANNYLVVDSYLKTTAVTAGGYCGVHAGFFNCIVKDNQVSNVLGTGGQYGTGMSIYLNVFNCLIDNNLVQNCGSGMNLAGGQMLSTYYTCAYNNVIQNNKFLGCNSMGTGTPSADNAAVRFNSLYSGKSQFNNVFVNNVIIGGRIYMQKQKNLVLDGNSLNTEGFVITDV
jgi:hypothetical protein